MKIMRGSRLEDEVINNGMSYNDVYQTKKVWVTPYRYGKKKYYAVNWETSNSSTEGWLFTVKNEALSFARKMTKKLG